jgi:hypothetical protein
MAGSASQKWFELGLSLDGLHHILCLTDLEWFLPFNLAL